MYRKCSKIGKLTAHAIIMSKGGLKKWLLEKMNQFSRSFERTEAATGSVL